jgi:two-component SAPR family response regulator
MINVLLISNEDGAFAKLKSGMRRYGKVKLYQAKTSGEALEVISVGAIDLVVTDEKIADMTGLGFAEKLVSVNPMVNCAVISPLSSREFHKASEGLGILAQLPVRPGMEEASILLERLEDVTGLILELA